MTLLNLSSRGTLLAGRVRQAIDHLPDDQPLKRWFGIELDLLESGVRQAAAMEEVSAHIRALRQLQFMALDQIVGARQSGDSEESMYTQMARLPGSLLQTVKQSNFSIEPELLLRPARSVDLFDMVSPTAKVVSHLRDRHDNLEFAQKLTCHDEADRILHDMGIVDPAVLGKLAVLFRTRYQSINAVLQRGGFRQVVEIASGISPRGLHWSREHPGTVYIESDLPALMRTKAKAMRDAIAEDPTPQRGVLHCCGVDALDLAGLRHALEYTDPQARLAVVTEGLLLYFDDGEMQRFLENIRTLLTEHPKTVWIVDMVSRLDLRRLFDSDPVVADAVRRIFASTDREVAGGNPFADDRCIDRRLAEHGLRVESRDALSDHAAQFVSATGQVPIEATAICGTRKIWTISACAAS